MDFFKRYNRIIGLTYLAVIAISVGLVLIQADTKYWQQITIMRESFNETASSIDHYLKTTTDHVALLRDQMQAYLDEGVPSSAGNPYIDHLEEVPGKNFFYAYPSAGATPIKDPAHLSGTGVFAGRSQKFYSEMRAALSMIPIFRGTIHDLHNSAWVYYTSAKGFIVMYPWISPKAYHFGKSTFEQEFYSLGLAKNNPGGKIFWTKAYIDQAGLGLMVTCSAPIYHESRFRGTLSIDITLADLNHFISAFPYKTANIFLINKRNELLAHTEVIHSEDRTVKPAAMGFPKNIRDRFRQVFERKPLEMQTIDGQLVFYQNIENAPWKLIFTAPKAKIYLSGIEDVAPVFIALILGLTLMLVIAHAVTRKDFIRPSRLLVDHIQNASDDPSTPVPDVQAAWRPWFETISHIFQEADRLMLELKAHNEHLDALVAQRTEELRKRNTELEETLLKVKEMQETIIMQEKMASLGMLTAGVAHEMKNPLNFINNFAELSTELIDELDALVQTAADRLPPDSRQETEELMNTLKQNIIRIRDHGKKADGIVRSMLLHSRGKSGERASTDFNKLIEEYVNLAYHGMRAREPAFAVSISTEFDHRIGMLDIVPQDLGRAVLNIVENACDAAYTKKKTMGEDFRAEVKVRTVDCDGHVDLCIRDNGYGIPADKQEKIFTPFYTTKPPGKGTGLGLSLAYDMITREHQGDIRVDSKAGEYTEFVISIPKA